jgi:dihydrofolate reductase
MRKIILNLAVSLDGYIEGPNGEIDWCLTDQDYGMEAFFDATDAIFMGRKSYNLIEGAPSPFMDKKIYVFTDTPFLFPNDDIEIIGRDNFKQKVDALRHAPGKNIWFFGGANLLSSFMAENLISEMLISIHPVILGGGVPLFQDIKNRVDLILLDQTTYSSGLIQIRYALKPKFDMSILDAQLSSLN